MQTDVLDALAESIMSRIAQKGATGTPTTVFANGPGGLFSQAGVNQDVISTVVQPTGLLSVLPAYGTVFMNPLFQFITGFRDDTGADPAGVCDNCKTAGIKKGCTNTAVFGRYCRETREMSVERLVQRVDRAEPTDLRLVNPIFTGSQMTPALTRQNPFAGEMQQALLEVGVSIERILSRQLWIGNPANNNVGGGYSEFPGLEILVGTGKVDAINGTSCPSLDSDIKDYAYQDVCAGSPSIVEVLTYLFRYLSKNARTMNCDPVNWAWVMREELFYELTSCWPCSYLSFRCTTSTADTVGSVDTGDAIAMRDAMRNGRYLLIDGRQIPVILDDGIPEDTNTNNANLAAGEFSSDIYLLPLSIRGSFATTYMEYQDFSKAQGQIDLAGMGMFYDVTDGGKFLWIRDNVRGCFLLQAVIKPRVLLLTPHLAGRLNNVKYVPLQHTREPFPTDGYFVDGGVVSRSTPPTYYNEWTERQ